MPYTEKVCGICSTLFYFLASLQVCGVGKMRCGVLKGVKMSFMIFWVDRGDTFLQNAGNHLYDYTGVTTQKTTIDNIKWKSWRHLILDTQNTSIED
jgi:hypothetical protein